MMHAEAEHFIAYIEHRRKAQGGKGKNIPGLCISDRTLQKDLCVLRNLYTWLVNTRHLADSPALRLPRLVCKPTQEQSWLSVDECFTLLEALDTSDFRQLRNYVIISLLWSTGLRVGELTRLTWKDVDLRKATMSLYKTKGGKSRMLYLNDRVLGDLHAYRKRFPDGADPDGPVFISLMANQNTKGLYGAITSNHVARMLRELVKACQLGVEVTPHILRHTFATNMYEAGCTVEQIKEMLGHDDETESCIYIHISAELAKQFLAGQRNITDPDGDLS